MGRRVAELRRFEEACRHEAAQKAEKRQRIERDQAAPFAPPNYAEMAKAIAVSEAEQG